MLMQGRHCDVALPLTELLVYTTAVTA